MFSNFRFKMEKLYILFGFLHNSKFNEIEIGVFVKNKIKHKYKYIATLKISRLIQLYINLHDHFQRTNLVNLEGAQIYFIHPNP